MTLEEAFEYLERIYVKCATEDVHTDKTIEAIKVVLASHPEARRDIIGYWKAMTFEPDLPGNRHIGKTASCHPWMHRVMRACRRFGWT